MTARFELRRVMVSPKLSEETVAFTADVWIDGAKAGDVRNSGGGGCHRYSSPNLERVLDAHAKTLPPVTFGDTTLAMHADLFVDELLAEHQARKRLAALMRTKVVFIRDGKALAAPLAAQIKALRPGDRVLNDMADALALSLFRAATEA